MGASDHFTLPLQAQYLLENVLQKRTFKKIAWLGVPHPYYPSQKVSEKFPNIEQHYYDIIAVESEYTHVWNMNDVGWGSKLRDEGFDVITLFRVTLHALDSAHLINEIRDFTSNTKNCVVFEDMVGRSKNEPITYRRGDGYTFTSPTNCDEYVDQFKRIMKVSSIKNLPYGRGDLTGIFVVLENFDELPHA